MEQIVTSKAAIKIKLPARPHFEQLSVWLRIGNSYVLISKCVPEMHAPYNF